MYLIKHFWYLIQVERQKETVKELMSQMMSLIRTKLVLAILRQFSSCFGLFDIAG
jgi:chaperone required for assembly of F1-ATPase